MKKVLKWLKARAFEPSTWAGIAAVATAVGAPGLAVGAKVLGAAIGGGLIGHAEAPSAPTTASAAG